MTNPVKNWFIKQKQQIGKVYSVPFEDVDVPSTAPLPPDDRLRRPDETYTEYCARVPLAFQPTDGPKYSYRGKPL